MLHSKNKIGFLTFLLSSFGSGLKQFNLQRTERDLISQIRHIQSSEPSKYADDLYDDTKPEPLNLFESADDDSSFAMRMLEDYQDVQLFIEVSVGTPSQPMRLIVDSGSTWFWVQTEACRNCGGHAKFDP